MTKRDFFILMIKLFGLWSLVKTLFSVSLFGTQIFDISNLLALLIALGVMGGLFWLLTFKAAELVDFLKLTSGFSAERIELGNIKGSDIIKTGTFIIGGLMIVENVPGFLSYTFWALKKNIDGSEFGSRDKLNLAMSGLKILFGYLLAMNYHFVSKFLKEKETQE